MTGEGSSLVGDDLSKKNLLPFGTTPSSPVMVIPDKEKFLSEKGEKAKNYFYSKFEELKEEFDNLEELANDTDRIYNAEYRFEPRLGKLYYLYENDKGQEFLSLIEPEKWGKFKYFGAYKFTSEGTWEKQEE